VTTPSPIAPPSTPEARADRTIVDARRQAESGNAAAAEAACRAVLGEFPDHFEALILLGELRLTADPTEAEALMRRVAERDPDNPEPRFHLGNLLRNRDEPALAVEQYERAVAVMPRHVGLLNNLGLAIEATGDLDRAERCYRDALAVEPHHPDALGNLASVLYELHDRRGSAEVYRRLLAIRRDLPAAVFNRYAMAEEEIGNFDSAETGFRAALAAAPTDRRIRVNLATLLVERMKFADAEPLLEAAIELEPDHVGALTSLVKVRQNLCKWDGIDAMVAQLVGHVLHDDREETGDIDPFILLSMPVAPDVHLRASKRWASRFAPTVEPPWPHVRLAPGERPRVAFISSDFRMHPMVQTISEVFERIDRTRLHAIAYGTVVEDVNPLGGGRIKGAIESFVDASQLTDDALIERLRADRIAIAFDLNGYTKGCRETIFARRVAPIQVNAIGYPGTLGAPWYDYILVDRFGLPPEQAMHYSERPLYMPNSAYPGDTTRAPKNPPPPRAALGLPDDGFVFCSLNNTYKIHHAVFAIWMRLLTAVPRSVLWLLISSEDTKRNLQAEADRHGVDPDRLLFAARVPPRDHLARLAAADLAVDTFPYGGHTTTNELLLVGVPVVTCVGDALPSRLAGSQLRALGVPELVTDNLTDYEALALRLAQDPAELAMYRARIAANRLTYPLFDMASYAREFADALLRAWDDYVTTADRR
jgi:predicted O-linked N-acetylglucosamine transferase (SPINDLY family)